MTPTSHLSDVSERDPVEVLAEEFFARQRRGEQPTVDEYAERYPSLAGRIREMIPALQMIEDVAPRSTASPDRLGEYRVIRELGRGGMGVVCEAVQESLGRRVALKLLPPAAARDAAYLERFRREAQTAARLHHTNIVPVYGAGEANGVHFLALQLISGVGLERLLAALRFTGPAGPTDTTGDTATEPVAVPSDLPAGAARLVALCRADRPAYWRAAAELAAQAADALAYAHANGVVHRDVKPSNLLLDDAGTLWVSDFGLAKAEGTDDLTQTGVVVGTPRYLAPERLDGTDSPAADVYALGATLYELLTLAPAFDAPDRVKLLAAIHTAEPVPPRVRAPGLPRDLETVVLKCLAKEPERRYAAAELTGDLRRFLAGRPVHARRVGPVERLVRWARRNPLVAGLTAALFLSLTGGLAASLYYGWRAEVNAAGYRLEFERAERHLAAARQAVEDYFTTVSESTLLDVPGLQSLRRDLLQAALPYYQKFLDERGDDPALRREVAAAHTRLGGIQSALGQQKPAVDHYLRATDLLRDEKDDAARGDLSAALLGLGIEYASLGQSDAIQIYDEALTVLEALQRARPDDFQIAQRLARLRFQRGIFYDRRSQNDRAAAEWGQVAGVLGPWRARQPNDPRILEPLASTQYSLASTDRRSGRLPAAIDRLREARDLAEQALAGRSGNWRIERLLADIDGALGNSLAAAGQPAEAAVALGRAVDRLTRLSAANPDVPGLRFTLGQTARRQASALQAAGDRPAARRAAEAAVATVEPLLAAQPANTGYRQLLGEAVGALGLLRIDTGQYDEGLADLARSVATIEPLTRLDKPSPYHLNLLATAHYIHGHELDKLKRPEPAADALRASVEWQRRVVAALPQSATMRQDLGKILNKQADALAAAGRTAEAETAGSEARTLLGK